MFESAGALSNAMRQPMTSMIVNVVSHAAAVRVRIIRKCCRYYFSSADSAAVPDQANTRRRKACRATWRCRSALNQAIGVR